MSGHVPPAKARARRGGYTPASENKRPQSKRRPAPRKAPEPVDNTRLPEDTTPKQSRDVSGHSFPAETSREPQEPQRSVYEGGQNPAEQDDDEDQGASGGKVTSTRSVSEQAGGGLVMLFLWPLAVNLIKGGPSQMWGWVKAKFINEPYGAGTGPGTGTTKATRTTGPKGTHTTQLGA